MFSFIFSVMGLGLTGLEDQDGGGAAGAVGAKSGSHRLLEPEGGGSASLSAR